MPITLLTRLGGGSEEDESCVFGKSEKGFPTKGTWRTWKWKKMALFIDSTHFAGAFCLKKLFLNIQHASFVLVSLEFALPCLTCLDSLNDFY